MESQVSPEDHMAIPGGDAYFYCKSDEPVTWKFGERVLPDNSMEGIEDGLYFLKLREVTYGNSGTYYCYGVIKGTHFRSSSEFIVIGEGLCRCCCDCVLGA